MMYWVTERLDSPTPHTWDGKVGSGKPPTSRCAPVVLGSDWVPGTLWGEGVSLVAQQGLDSLALADAPPSPTSLHRNGPGHLPEKLFPLISEIGKRRHKLAKSRSPEA